MKGQKISDRYQIIKNVGEGGMANVYLAHDTILDREVAVKVLRGDLANDEKFVRRFQREALAASSLSNPNIVEVYDVGEDEGEYYIVMEYIDGKHLKNLIKKRGKLTISEVIDIALQITNGLSVAHDSYLIHRDIKPQNILIVDSGLVKITDFGIAVAMNATQLTQTNSVMGSVHYLPPEQAMGKTATLQSDIYSIGILLYELLAGKLPYTGDNAVEIALKHLKENVPLISEVVSNIPQSIENIIIKATAKNPKNRYSDAREMHEDLKTCLDESRKNEAKIVLKHPETDYDETKVMKTVKPKEETKIDNKSKEKEDEIIAKKITKKDLKNENKTLVILGSIFTGLVVLVTTIVVLIPRIAMTSQVEVPDVSGKSTNEAIKILQDAGFAVEDETNEEISKTIEEGLVTRTTPLAGSERKEGSKVTLVISLGNPAVLIEDYVGLNYLTIKDQLEAKNLQVQIVEESDPTLLEDKEYEDGEISRQSIEPGTELSEKDIITLYVPNLTAKYPNFLEEEYTLDMVKTFAEDNKLTLAIEEVEVADTEYQVGAIIYQSRAAGSNVVSGYSLKVRVVVENKTTEPDPDPNENEDDQEACEGNALC